MATYDEQTALIVVGVQNDFADPSGSLSVDGGDAIVPRANQEIAATHEAGALVAYTQDWHPPITPHFSKDGGIWPEHCVRETRGTELSRSAGRGRDRAEGASWPDLKEA